MVYMTFSKDLLIFKLILPFTFLPKGGVALRAYALAQKNVIVFRDG